MAWLWFGIIGGIITPLLISGGSIFTAFQERGFGAGLAYWSGMLWFTIPIMVGVTWVVQKVVG